MKSNSFSSVLLRLLLGLLVIGLGAAALIGYQVQSFVSSAPSSEHEERVVLIPRGSSVGVIAALLQQEGVVTDADRFRLYVRLQKAGTKVRAGEFRFYTDLTPPQVLEILTSGEEVRYKLTFPEGTSIKDMARVVPGLPWLSGERFLALATDPDFTKSSGFSTPTLEGFLFPSTYELSRLQDERDLIQAMIRQFKNAWTPDLDARARAWGMSQLEVVTLASIVEKETGVGHERPMVASVFHNRLKRGMKLESDPTIIYGLTDYDGDIRRSDIRKAHPWNTYVIPALPPTPIANPGREALAATLSPADTDYLYFVAMGDGTHTFSRTYAEHAAKVVQYQVLRRNRK